MRDLFFVELRKNAEEIREIEKSLSEEKIKEYDIRLLDEIEKICNLGMIGRKEGLLALEAEIYEKEDIYEKYLKQMVTLIVDGTSPELVEEILLMQYMTKGFGTYEGLIYLLQMVGILSIQAGENPRVTEEKLLAMVSDRVCDRFVQKREEAFRKSLEAPAEDIDMTKVEAYYEGEITLNATDRGYMEIKLLDYICRQMDDRGIQRLLREVDNADLEIAMVGLSGEARQHLFRNMSKRLCVMVAEDLDHMETVDSFYIMTAAQKILNILFELVDSAEIICAQCEGMELLSEIFHNYSRTITFDLEDNMPLSFENLINLMKNKNGFPT